MNAEQTMCRIDTLLAHVWMVRQFLKHADEADEPELQEVRRVLYDYMLALGKPWSQQDAEAYLKQARKKLPKLQTACTLFVDVAPEISGHTNFQMATTSLQTAVAEIGTLLDSK